MNFAIKVRAEQVYLLCRAVAKSRHYAVLPQKCGALRAEINSLETAETAETAERAERAERIDDTLFRCCLFRLVCLCGLKKTPLAPQPKFLGRKRSRMRFYVLL